MKNYVVLFETEEDTEVIKVTTDVVEAQKAFEAQLIEARQIAKDNGWTIEEEDNYFEAYEDGFYDQGHVVVRIEEKE